MLSNRLLLLMLLFSLNACVVIGQHKGSDDEVARANVNLAAEYFRQDKLDYALSNLKKALKADPLHVEANTLIALVYNRLNERALAQEHFEIAAEHVMSDTNLYGQVHNNFGAFLCSHNQYFDGEEHIMLAIENKLYESPEAAYENAGLCALGRADAKAARLYFDKALAISPNMPRTLLEIAKLNYDEKKYLEAQSFLQRFHKINPPVAQSLWIASQVEFALGNKEKAQKLLAQLQQDFPESSEATDIDSLVIDQ